MVGLGLGLILKGFCKLVFFKVLEVSVSIDVYKNFF